MFVEESSAAARRRHPVWVSALRKKVAISIGCIPWLPVSEPCQCNAPEQQGDELALVMDSGFLEQALKMATAGRAGNAQLFTARLQAEALGQEIGQISFARGKAIELP